MSTNPVTADFITVDVYFHPIHRTFSQRRRSMKALAGDIDGLRSWSVNYANSGTVSLIPKPTGTCLVLAWDSAEVAHAAWAGDLGAALGGPGDYRLDGEVARARAEHPENSWYGWRPSDAGVEPMAREEPLVVVVHGVVKPRYLKTFVSDNVHAASRALHHPGHRGSIDIFSKAPFENTSVSIWSSVAQAQNYAYAPGGHSYAMKHSRELATHHTGVFLQVRPLASSGSLGIDRPALPELPATAR